MKTSQRNIVIGIALLLVLAFGIVVARCGPDSDEPVKRQLGPGLGGGFIPPTKIGTGTGGGGGISAVVADSPMTGSGSAGSHLKFSDGTSAGQLLAWNGTAWAANNYCGDPSQRYCFLEEFEFGTTCSSGKFAGNASGTGASCTYTANTDGHPGVVSMQTGTTVTSGIRWSLGSGVVLGGGQGIYTTKSLVMVQNLSTTVIEYLFKFGFSEPSSNAESVDAIEAVYDRPVTGDKWALKTCSNSVCTTTICDGTGGTVNKPILALTWYTAEITLNAAGTSATLAINGQVCATNTTNIPTGSTRATSIGAQCFNNTGTVPANQICYVDYTAAMLPFGVAR
ncbi:MAG: hypothetical protein H0U52_06855 [Chloroflexi bacterium]|nr:hypothetical protein [Chloroflexota bacterium]